MTTTLTFFSSIKHVLIPLQNSLEMGKKHAQKRGLLAIKEIATLSCAVTQAGGTVAFLDQSLVNIKDL